MVMDAENLKAIINAIPGNVFFKDTECRYRYTSHLCSMLNTAGRPDFTIIGKTDLEVQVQKELGEQYYNEDKELLSTGGEMEYVSKMTFGSDSYYYKIQKRAVHSCEDGKDSIIGVVGVVTDITQETVLRQRLEYLSSTDALTGLKNRASLMLWLSQPFPEGSLPLTILSADFDNLKILNDKHGHDAGDSYLKTGTQTMQGILPEDACIYRTGGDEFLVTVPSCSEEKSRSLIEKIGEAFGSCTVEGVPMSVSLGAVTLTDTRMSLSDAIKEADKRMYEQKRAHHTTTPRGR
ncbi:MAG: diguanylate cyclase [Treponema sp.]|nr:diguanylate cyclase [Treponema sp.]